MSQGEMKVALNAENVRAVRAATRRCGFSPEALETLERTIDDVWSELAAPRASPTATRCATGSRRS